MRGSYYNEIDPYCVAWLRNLIDAGHIAAGDVDDRSIEDVRADDLTGYSQCHFFAGIGGWSLALRLAGVEDSAKVWTGSPPCQDNSVASAIHGRRTGLRGARSGLAHVWLDLVDAIRPGAVRFENVPGISPWVAEIKVRLEGFGYGLSEPKLSSKSVGAPHIRERVWIAADLGGEGLPITRRSESPTPFQDPRATAPGNYWFEDSGRFRPVDDGLSERVAQVRAFGNAIDPFVAAAFIKQTARIVTSDDI